MRVVVADDVMLTRQGIVRPLRDAGIEVVAEAEDAHGLLHHAYWPSSPSSAPDQAVEPSVSTTGRNHAFIGARASQAGKALGWLVQNPNG